MGYKVEERDLSIDELMEAGRTGQLKEAWGTGTAAVISPIGELCYKVKKSLFMILRLDHLHKNFMIH